MKKIVICLLIFLPLFLSPSVIHINKDNPALPEPLYHLENEHLKVYLKSSDASITVLEKHSNTLWEQYVPPQNFSVSKMISREANKLNFEISRGESSINITHGRVCQDKLEFSDIYSRVKIKQLPFGAQIKGLIKDNPTPYAPDYIWEELVNINDINPTLGITRWHTIEFIPEIGRWVFGTTSPAPNSKASIVISDDLETFTIAKTFTSIDSIRALKVIRWNGTVRVLAGLGAMAGGIGKPEVWYSDNYGNTWTKAVDLSSFEANFKRVNEFIELNNGNVLALGGGTGKHIWKIFISSDHGLNWATLYGKQTSVCGGILRAAYDSESDVVGLACGGGFYYSTDGCVTVQEGYVTDGAEGRIKNDRAYSVTYDSDSHNWFFGIDVEPVSPTTSDVDGLVFRVSKDDIDDYKKYVIVKDYTLPGDLYVVIPGLYYVPAWRETFVAVGHDTTGNRIGNYVEVWSFNDGIGSQQKMEIKLSVKGHIQALYYANNTLVVGTTRDVSLGATLWARRSV